MYGFIVVHSAYSSLPVATDKDKTSQDKVDHEKKSQKKLAQLGILQLPRASLPNETGLKIMKMLGFSIPSVLKHAIKQSNKKLRYFCCNNCRQ